MNKHFLLFLLVIQNTAIVLFVKASKIRGSSEYLESTIVFLNEVMKFFVMSVVHIWSGSKIREFIEELQKPYNLLYMIPCLVYALQNRIVFLALSMIDTTLYQALSNMKIITTAVFAVIMMNKVLHRIQWFALILLATGAVFAETQHDSDSEDHKGSFTSPYKGLILMFIFSTLSGFAGVFMEKMFKSANHQSFYLKQMMLYFWGSVVNLLLMFSKDGLTISEKGLFTGYTVLTWIILFNLIACGITVAMVITYFDNIIKVYVSCISIFTTALASYFLFGFHYSFQFSLAVLIVCISIVLYNDPATIQPPEDTVTTSSNVGKGDYVSGENKF